MGGRQAVRPRPLEPVSKVRILPAQPDSATQPAVILKGSLAVRRSRRDVDADLTVGIACRGSVLVTAAKFFQVTGEAG